MTNPKDPKTNMTEEDRLRRDEALMNSLKIFHKPENTSDTWPLHLTNTLQSIDTLGHFRYLSYDDEAPAPHSTSTWRREIKSRAKQISDIAKRLHNEKPTEMTWRLELEKLVDARFCLRTECKTCSDPDRSGRLWRSEIEVMTEDDGRITQELRLRRKTRVPCRCLEATYSGLNPLFSNRADQEFSYDPHFTKDPKNGEHGKNPSSGKMQLPKRRPDRLYGLRQTPNFEKYLSSPAKDVLDDTAAQAVADLMHTVDDNCEAPLVQNFIQATPFLQRGDPLLFPFLIVEAKSEEGHGHRNCGIQTALPIWALLKSQERLSDISSCPLEELGGPLVWYISYLGDNWQLSACYVVTASGEKTYQILDLWNGRISSPDGALQILLIIDYIFDWARDLYRPSILHCLSLLSHGVDESISLAAESDVNSIRKRARVDDMAEMESTIDIEAFETPAIDESLLEAWIKYDLLAFRSVVDLNKRVFRTPYIVKSSFQCLYLTRDNMGSLISCLATSFSKLKKTARDALAALRRGPMIITDRILSEMESTWTGENRESRRLGASTQLFCSIVHAVTVSTETWNLERTIFCIAVDQDALQDIRKHAKLSSKMYRLDGMEEKAVAVDESTVKNFLQYLKNRGGEDNLSFALAHISEVWKPTHMLSKEERGTLSHGAEQTIVLQPLFNGMYPIRDVVQSIYKRHKPSGLLEPDAPCLRFSAQRERLEIQHLTNHPRSLPLSKGTALPIVPANSAIFLCNKDRSYKHLCIYITKEYQNPPEKSELISIIASIISDERFFILNRYKWDDEAHSMKIQLEVHPEDGLLPLIKIAAQQWAQDFYKKFDKDSKKGDIPKIFDDGENAIQKLWDAERYHHRPFSDEDIHHQSNKRPRFMPQNFNGVPDSGLPKSKDAVIQALLKKWGPADLLKSVLKVVNEAGHGNARTQDEDLGTSEQPNSEAEE